MLDEEHIYEAMDESLASESFLITSVPYSGIRHKGFPLDALSVDIVTGKYFYEMSERKADQIAVEDGFLQFFGKLKELWENSFQSEA